MNDIDRTALFMISLILNINPRLKHISCCKNLEQNPSGNDEFMRHMTFHKDTTLRWISPSPNTNLARVESEVHSVYAIYHRTAF